MHNEIEQAVKELRQGQLVIIPTETVYGLAADASNEVAIKKIFALKNRPHFNPLISHYADIAEIEKDVYVDARAQKILKHLSPGPITLVLKKKDSSRISALATAGLDTAAVRIPRHKTTLEILRKFQGPIAAPSANLSTQLSPTKVEHAQKAFAGKVNLIIDGDASSEGLESTILDLTSSKAIILRFGTYTSQEIENVLEEKIFLHDNKGEIKAPGMLLKHYSPAKSKLRMSTDSAQENEALLAFGVDDIPTGFSEILNLSPSKDLAQAAKNLFSYIHHLEEKGFSSIAVMPIPNEGIGIAINDKLKRASAQSPEAKIC
jgi:L-threonylcarbamoyladenylate synthase